MQRPLCNTTFLPRPLVVKPSPPKPSPTPKPSDKPSIYLCPTCTTFTALPPTCQHPHYTIPPADPEYADALALFLNPPC